MTLYECAKCGAISGVGYRVGLQNWCYDCRMAGTRGYEKISKENRRAVILVRGDLTQMQMSTSVQKDASGGMSLVLTPKRTMTLEGSDV